MHAQDKVDDLKRRMQRYMETAGDDIVDLRAAHPRPWTWMASYHDGAGIQFIDARGNIVLRGLIYDVEVAADLLKTINAT